DRRRRAVEQSTSCSGLLMQARLRCAAGLEQFAIAGRSAVGRATARRRDASSRLPL
ncbi:MAG: hypothetical protein AVDCRST_MAG67-2811, partial [uncultured Solirubrobacteraceae bacterium]